MFFSYIFAENKFGNLKFMKEINKKPDDNYSSLIDRIGGLLTEARNNVAVTINNVLVKTYWEIGRYIVEYEQNGSERAEYGSGLLNRLSTDLTDRYGKGFSRSNILYMRKLYVIFPISETLSHFLTWSHYFEILKLNDPLEISFYIHECENAKWSVRELKRQRDSMLFHRLATGKDKEGILKLANKGIELHNPEDILRDYLNYFRHEVNRDDDNEPIGIVLGSSNDSLTIQYALEGISNKLLVSRYQLYLPTREQLAKEILKTKDQFKQKK